MPYRCKLKWEWNIQYNFLSIFTTAEGRGQGWSTTDQNCDQNHFQVSLSIASYTYLQRALYINGLFVLFVSKDVAKYLFVSKLDAWSSIKYPACISDIIYIYALLPL